MRPRHVGGLPGDDAEELPHLGPVDLASLLQQRRRRAAEGGPKLAPLVASLEIYVAVAADTKYNDFSPH